jgi:hypothetical protein
MEGEPFLVGQKDPRARHLQKLGTEARGALLLSVNGWFKAASLSLLIALSHNLFEQKIAVFDRLS